MPNIIFVCTGNICRSPLAEELLRMKWKSTNRKDLSVSSMGIHGLKDQPASGTMQRVCEPHGINLSNHKSRTLVFDELNRADHIFTMEMVQKEFIQLYLPHLADRIALLGAWPEADSSKHNIKDPIRGTIKDYQETFSSIDGHINRILPHLLDMFREIR
jgi:protein-tyrosine-phosphatase